MTSEEKIIRHYARPDDDKSEITQADYNEIYTLSIDLNDFTNFEWIHRCENLGCIIVELKDIVQPELVDLFKQATKTAPLRKLIINGSIEMTVSDFLLSEAGDIVANGDNNE